MPSSSVHSNAMLSLESSLLIPSVSLADKNWFKTGGAADYFAEPTTPEEFQVGLTTALAHDLPVTLVGEGANMLINDAGVSGLVIRPQLKALSRTEQDEQYSLVTAGAGVSFGDLITWCLDNNLSGLEEFSGIPGSVGGAVFINIHYYEFLLGQFIIGAQVIEKVQANYSPSIQAGLSLDTTPLGSMKATIT